MLASTASTASTSYLPAIIDIARRQHAAAIISHSMAGMAGAAYKQGAAERGERE